MARAVRAAIVFAAACAIAAGVYGARASESANDPFYTPPIVSAQAEHGASDPYVAPQNLIPAAPDGEETGGHENGGAKKGLPQFDPSSFPSQVFWLAITFAALYFYFSKVTFPQIASTQHRRKARVEHDLKTAQEMRLSAETAKARYETAASEAQMRATAIYKKAQEEVKIKLNAGIEEFKALAARRLQDAEAQIERSKKEAMEAIQAGAAEAASQAAQKIIGVASDVADARAVVDNLRKKAA